MIIKITLTTYWKFNMGQTLYSVSSTCTKPWKVLFTKFSFDLLLSEHFLDSSFLHNHIHQQALRSLLSVYIPTVTISHHSHTSPLVHAIFILQKDIIGKYNNLLTSFLPPTLVPIQLFTIQQQNDVLGSKSDYVTPFIHKPPVEQ